ncbi:MAG TPA: copper-binding protein [Pyrinomonadaceae bacterium]|nr:copper-binding protein [Pyrinomonadaceae bacterium]
MKICFKLNVILLVSFSVISFACSNQESLKPVSPNTEVQTYKSKGVIKKIDAEIGKLTVDHEDIPGYMSAMEMTEAAKDKALLDNVKVGDKVDFEIERTGSKIVFTKLTKTGEVAVVNGAEIYKANCASCHGANGEGAKKGIPLTSGHALHHSEAEHIKQVTDGEGEKMPAFKDKLSAEEIKAVVDFVRNELQKGANREDSHKHSH